MLVPSNIQNNTVLSLIFFLALIVGCTKSIDEHEIEERAGLVYRKGEANPYTGNVIKKFENGDKHYENHYKDGVPNGKWVYWDKYGEKTEEGEKKDGEDEEKKKDGESEEKREESGEDKEKSEVKKEEVRWVSRCCIVDMGYTQTTCSVFDVLRRNGMIVTVN